MVTAVLITHNRQRNIPKIVESLLKVPVIDEIMIWDNSKHDNVINYGRYLMAMKAKNDFIYTQDDDALISNVLELINAYDGQITHTGTQEYLDRIVDHTYGDRQMAMFGWGAIFRKDWIACLGRYIEKYDKDYCFYRETDRIFSVLHGGHHKAILGQIEHLDGYKDEHSLSAQSDHITYKELAIKRSLELCQK